MYNLLTPLFSSTHAHPPPTPAHPPPPPLILLPPSHCSIITPIPPQPSMSHIKHFARETQPFCLAKIEWLGWYLTVAFHVSVPVPPSLPPLPLSLLSLPLPLSLLTPSPSPRLSSTH